LILIFEPEENMVRWMEGLMVKEIKPIKGIKGREQYRRDIVKMLAETNEPIPLYELLGWWRDIKDLESQGLLIIDNSKTPKMPKMVSLTEKGKSYVVYGKSEGEVK
jgi:hypothetical protein